MTEVRIPWFRDYQLALRVAAKERKLLVVHLALPGRPMCDRMQREVFTGAQLAEVLREEFVCVSLNAKAHSELFQRSVGSRGALATCVMDFTEDVLAVLPGFASEQTLVETVVAAREGYTELVNLRQRASGSVALANLALAQRYYKLGSSKRAEVELTRVSTEGVRALRAAAQERLARLHIEAGRTAVARELLAQATEAGPPSGAEAQAQAGFTRALILFSERSLGLAREQVYKLLEQFPNCSDREAAQELQVKIQRELFADLRPEHGHAHGENL